MASVLASHALVLPLRLRCGGRRVLLPPFAVLHSAFPPVLKLRIWAAGQGSGFPSCAIAAATVVVANEQVKEPLKHRVPQRTGKSHGDVRPVMSPSRGPRSPSRHKLDGDEPARATGKGNSRSRSPSTPRLDSSPSTPRLFSRLYDRTPPDKNGFAVSM